MRAGAQAWSCGLGIPGPALWPLPLQEFHVDVVILSKAVSQNHGLEAAVPQGHISWGCVVSLLVYGLEQGQTADASSPDSPTAEGQCQKMAALETHSRVRAGGSGAQSVVGLISYTFSEVL